MKLSRLSSIALGGMAIAASTAAFAVDVGIGINLGAPAVVAPAPVYVAPQPVYVAPPPPVVVAPAPPIVMGWHGDRYWDGYRYWGREDWYRHHGRGPGPGHWERHGDRGHGDHRH